MPLLRVFPEAVFDDDAGLEVFASNGFPVAAPEISYIMHGIVALRDPDHVPVIEVTEAEFGL